MLTLQIWRGCFFDGTDDSSIRAPRAREGKVWGRERVREMEKEKGGGGEGGIERGQVKARFKIEKPSKRNRNQFFPG